jgi:hypothetical protein
VEFPQNVVRCDFDPLGKGIEKRRVIPLFDLRSAEFVEATSAARS